MGWRYYVYTLTDPRDGQLFYIGKGCNKRIDEHEREARKGVESPKCDRIRSIIADGLAVEKARIAYFKAEAAAYAFEASLIQEHRSALTNGGQVGCDPLFLKMRLLACALKAKHGVYVEDREKRPFRSALIRAMKERADEFIAKFSQGHDFESLRRHLSVHGVKLITG